MDVKDKKCIACSVGTPVLQDREAQILLEKLHKDWSFNTKNHIEKKFTFADFIHSLSFANKIGDLAAEEERYHPSILVQWGECVVEIWTHKINGLSESDFYLAAKIDDLWSKTN